MAPETRCKGCFGLYRSPRAGAMIAQLKSEGVVLEGPGFPGSRPLPAGFLGLGKVVILRAPARPLQAAGGLLQRKASMAFDFTPSDEQKMLVETVRQFMAEEIFPHEREVERKGEVPLELGKQIQKRAMEMGLYRREHAGRGRRRRARLRLGDADGSRARQIDLGAGRMDRPALGDSQCLPRRSARGLSLPGDPRRAQGGLRPDRAQCRLGCHGHPDPRGQGRRGLCHQRQQAFHQLRDHAGFRHPLHRHRRQRDAARARASRSPPSWSMSAPRDSRYAAAPARSPIAAITTTSFPSAIAGSPRATSWARRARASSRPASGWPIPGSWSRRIAAARRSGRWRSPPNGRRPASSSARPSAASRASASSWPIWRPS